MSKTYSQIILHIIFSTKDRLKMLNKELRPELYKYINGIISNKNQKLLRINGTNDHVHLLLSIHADCLVSELVKDIKTGSTKFINNKQLSNTKFYWQRGFGTFSVSKSQVEKVVDYINNLEKHHENRSFKEEFIELLDVHGIEYNKDYLFI